MNILMYLHRYPGYGGIESVTTYLANFFETKGINVSIYSFIAQDEDSLRGLLDSNIKIFHPISIEGHDSMVDSIKKVLTDNQIDIVVFQDSYAHVEDILLDAIRGTKAKLCVVEHNAPDCFLKGLKETYRAKLKWYLSILWLSYPVQLFRIRSEIKRRHRLLYSACDRYILLSSKFYTVLAKFIGTFDDCKVKSIHNPITVKLPRSRCFSKENICLFCGRLTEQKGIRYLMEIWSRVAPMNQDWKFIIVGDGPLRDYVLLKIRENNLNNVILTGFVSDPSEYYSKASILCMSSIFEGWMLSLVESMVYGCVPVTFNSYESVSDIIDNGINGILIEPFDVDDYVRRLMDLMHNVKKREDMSRKAIATSIQFDIQKIGAQWINLFNSLVH